MTAKPPALPWEVAGALYVTGCTAYAAVRAVGAWPGDTVAVSAAAGGVGSIAVQLLRLRGARVIAIASGRHVGWLQAQGATVVAYGDGVEDRIRAAALASRSKWVVPGWLWAWPRSTASKSG